MKKTFGIISQVLLSGIFSPEDSHNCVGLWRKSSSFPEVLKSNHAGI